MASNKWLIASLALSFFAQPAHALINAGLQPIDLFQRYRSVVSGEVVALNPEKHSITVSLTGVHKGSFEVGQRIEVTATEAVQSAFLGGNASQKIEVGSKVAAFAGKNQRRRANDLMIYINGFFLGQMESAEAWSLTDTDQEMIGIDQEAIPGLAGTWNGSAEKLIEMFVEIENGRSHFPRKAYARFQRDILIDDFDGEPIESVSMYDIDQDGDLDLYASSYIGDRIYLQVEPMVFVNATDWMQLEAESGSSSFADIDGDGDIDLLAGPTIYLQTKHRSEDRNVFRISEWISLDEQEDFKSSALTDLNADGYPDVIISKQRDGLRAFLNPGETPGPFIPATESMGLDQHSTGAGQTGFFSMGDWNDDGRIDLFYAAAGGFLLIQNSDGKFVPLDHGIHFDFRSGENEVLGMTGAGCFAPVVNRDRLDLIVPSESGWTVVENRNGVPVDVTEYGNEISEGSYLHLATIVEDLNCDGHNDLFTISRAENGHNRYIINRGYGSFMLASVHKYYEKMFDGPTHQSGGSCVISGDVNNDGAPDLLIGNEAGKLVLIVNDTLAHRKPVEHPIDDIARILEMGQVVVHVKGPQGVLGAKVRVIDSGGTVIHRKDVGSNIATGSRSSDTVTLTIREPGDYTLRVTYSDGLEQSSSITVRKLEKTVLNASRSGISAN